MSSKIKAVIISAIVLVLLIGAVVALKLTGKSDSSSSSSSSGSSSVSSKLLYEEKQADVASVYIKNSEGEYEVTQVDDANWTIDELKDLPLDNSVLSGITSAVTSITTQKMIEENASDLSKYGLDKPLAEVKVTFKDSAKTVKEFLIGNPTPTSGQSYFALKGEKTVYTVTTATFSSLTQGKLAAVKKIIVDTPKAGSDGTTAYPVIRDITIQRSDLPYNVVLAYQKPKTDLTEAEESASSAAAAATGSGEYDSTHVMAEPIKSDLNAEKASPLVRGMFGLTATKIAAVHPTQDELTKAGITAPTAVVITELEDKTYKLTIGAAVAAADDTEAGYYGYVEGTDILYQFSTASLPWVSFKPDDIKSGLMPLNNIYDVAKIEIKTSSEDVIFKLSGDDSDTFKVLKDDVEMDGDYFKKFYQFVIGAPAEFIWLENPTSTTPDVKVIYTMENGTVSNVEFYKSADRQTIIKYNGETRYKCRTTYVERLLSNLALLDDKGDMVMTY